MPNGVLSVVFVAERSILLNGVLFVFRRTVNVESGGLPPGLLAPHPMDCTAKILRDYTRQVNINTSTLGLTYANFFFVAETMLHIYLLGTPTAQICGQSFHALRPRNQKSRPKRRVTQLQRKQRHLYIQVTFRCVIDSRLTNRNLPLYCFQDVAHWSKKCPKNRHVDFVSCHQPANIRDHFPHR